MTDFTKPKTKTIEGTINDIIENPSNAAIIMCNTHAGISCSRHEEEQSSWLISLLQMIIFFVFFCIFVEFHMSMGFSIPNYMLVS